MRYLRVIKTFMRLFFISFFFLVHSSPVFGQDSIFKGRKISHSFYITANTGESSKTDILNAVSSASEKDRAASILLLGNVTSKTGYPQEGHDRKSSEEFLRKDL